MSGTNKFLWLDLFSRKSESEITVLSTLKSNQLFTLLSPRELREVAHVVHVRTYENGELIFEQYEKGLGMYMIAKGNIEIKVSEVLVTTLNAGSFFGELALVDADNKRTASAFAQGQATLIGFFKPDLLELMERRPQTGVKILFQLARVLGRRLNETTELITSTRMQVQAAPTKKAG